MAVNWQKGILFAVGVAVGVGAGVAGVIAWRDGQFSQASDPGRTLGGPAATSASAPASAIASTAIVAAATECGVPPILPRKGANDGKLSLQSKPSAASASEVAALILSGKEAAASGRDRDAEVAFLNACRNAALLSAEPIPAADAMYQLARHYANVAAFGAQPARQLYARAERFYSASLLTYTARYGAGHEKTRFATEGLKTVQQATGGNGPVAVAKVEPPKPAAPAPVPAAKVAPAPATAPAVAAPTATVAPPAMHAPTVSSPPVAAATPPAREAPPAHKPREPQAAAPVPQEEHQVAAAVPAPAPAPQARRSNPSFDCASARSVTEKLICGDEALARQDRELGRLHQRAKRAAADPRAFQRESDAKWQDREQTCRDRECLQRWYAQRRAELGAAVAPAQPTARSSTPEQRAPTTSAGAGAARPLDEAEPVTRAPVLRTPPMRARVAEPEEQPAEPGVASGSAGVAPQAEGSANDPP